MRLRPRAAGGGEAAVGRAWSVAWRGVAWRGREREEALAWRGEARESDEVEEHLELSSSVERRSGESWSKPDKMLLAAPGMTKTRVLF